MAMSSLRESLPLVAATTLATILITSQIKPIARPVKTIFSRFYLQCFVLSGKNATAEGSDGSSSSSSSESNNTTVVTALNTYPVKSLRAVPCEEAVLDARGFVGDRRYMLVTAAPLPLWGSFGPNDATHRFLTQRQCPILARVVVSVHDDGTMTLSSDVLPKEIFRISTGPAADAPIYKSTLWGDLVTVQDMSDVAATFMQKIVAADAEIPEELKKGVRMVMQSVQDSRTANDKFVPATARTLTGMNPRVSLADGFPLYVSLLIFFTSGLNCYSTKLYRCKRRLTHLRTSLFTWPM